MINFKKIFDDIFLIITKKQSIFEFLLNLSFVLIIFIIIVILYWDSINRSIINNSRCKITINDTDHSYNLKFYDRSNNTNVFDISYDATDNHNVKIDCACPIGEYPNKLIIPIYNQKDKKFETINKFCYCDNGNYKTDITNENYKMDGDAFLMDYYEDLIDGYSSGNIEYSPINFQNN